jgi:uncharacterized membrane protein (UPF0127 family)
VRGARVLASVELAERPWARLRGLLGRRGIDGALLLRPARGVHSFGMRFDIDVAFCDEDLCVLRVERLRRNRMTAPCTGARVVIETEAGVMSSWELAAGDRLALRGPGLPDARSVDP